MELYELRGKHILQGVELGAETFEIYEGREEVCNYVKFTLDGVTYKAVEDPSDGYRSYMQDLIVDNSACETHLPDIEVVCTCQENDGDILNFIDTANGKKILEIGTDYTDSYYPYCVFNYWPGNMSCNENAVTDAEPRATCKDCLHYEACNQYHGTVVFPVDDGVCLHFADKTEYVKRERGEWLPSIVPGEKRVYCSVCMYLRDPKTQTGWEFCPTCGADMRGNNNA